MILYDPMNEWRRRNNEFEAIDRCAENLPEHVIDRQDKWHADFQPVMCDHVADFDIY